MSVYLGGSALDEPVQTCICNEEAHPVVGVVCHAILYSA